MLKFSENKERILKITVYSLAVVWLTVIISVAYNLAFSMELVHTSGSSIPLIFKLGAFFFSAIIFIFISLLGFYWLLAVLEVFDSNDPGN